MGLLIDVFATDLDKDTLLQISASQLAFAELGVSSPQDCLRNIPDMRRCAQMCAVSSCSIAFQACPAF